MTQPSPAPYRPETAILELGDAFYDPVEPARFPKHVTRFRNDRAAAEVGLADLSPEAWTAHFGRFEPLPGSLPQPLALRYHGHQFRSYNPDLGDGRGFLFAQLREDGRRDVARDGHDRRGGRLMDLGTKGSGQTPYSRFGDGRLTLKGGVREVLATEMLEALGVPTSRSFSLIETGEALERNDEPSPTRSAVLVRLSHSHVRYGSFQRLAYHKDAASMERLVDYVLRHFVGEVAGDRYAAFMEYATRGAARLAAAWNAAGFVHGVLNTDNMNITGESFDYGPWRWLPMWDPAFTAAYFDHHGLYAFGRQAEAVHWNLYQLALALRLVAPVESLVPPLQAYPELYEAAYAQAVLRRLGLAPRGSEADLALLQAFETGMSKTGVQPDRAFFDWRGGRRRAPSPADAHYADAAFAPFTEQVAAYEAARHALDHPYWSDPEPCSMLIDEVEAIWAPIAEADDWSRFEAKVAAVRRMGEAMRSTA